ncbi:NADP-dependent oxidoreductase [Kineococcus rubinsiae]|uniref:NADP-dependent oxidoreductase n=1 Tax=Kineococcus rubinsiae TaxID=2609562 RepID=UPI00142F934B|nr:NADP-dependent oxidoreductase [Kineococcus rubinsiae]NIZ89657.1 NADP-dependent oxidoreductase [Kineococcus rubinsiae]
MRAFVLTEFGATPQVVDIDVPEPAAGEVRVRVHAASVNGFDLSVAKGRLEGMMEHRFPVVLGKDFAGVVDALGEGVADYAVGDRVFGVVTKAHLGDGSFAEYVTVSTAVGLAKLPEGVDFTTGAALGLAGAAAVSSVDAAELQSGEKVLVVGATGGVGNQAVQWATAAGAHVTGTAATSQEKDLVATLGAQATVDHTGDLIAQVRELHPEGVDVVFHFAGDAQALLSVLRPGGRLVSTIVQPAQLPTEDATVIGIYTNPDADTLGRIAAGAAGGTTQLTIQHTLPLEQTQQAFDTFAGGTLGKVVVTTA